jgi:hypothetical protein
MLPRVDEALVAVQGGPAIRCVVLARLVDDRRVGTQRGIQPLRAGTGLVAEIVEVGEMVGELPVVPRTQHRVEIGEVPAQLDRVRVTRPGAVETRARLGRFQPGEAGTSATGRQPAARRLAPLSPCWV